MPDPPTFLARHEIRAHLARTSQSKCVVPPPPPPSPLHKLLPTARCGLHLLTCPSTASSGARREEEGMMQHAWRWNLELKAVYGCGLPRHGLSPTRTTKTLWSNLDTLSPSRLICSRDIFELCEDGEEACKRHEEDACRRHEEKDASLTDGDRVNVVSWGALIERV